MDSDGGALTAEAAAIIEQTTVAVARLALESREFERLLGTIRDGHVEKVTASPHCSSAVPMMCCMLCVLTRGVLWVLVPQEGVVYRFLPDFADPITEFAAQQARNNGNFLDAIHLFMLAEVGTMQSIQPPA